MKQKRLINKIMEKENFEVNTMVAIMASMSSWDQMTERLLGELEKLKKANESEGEKQRSAIGVSCAVFLAKLQIDKKKGGLVEFLSEMEALKKADDFFKTSKN